MTRRQPNKKRRQAASEPAETRGTDFVTVGWMVVVLTTLTCEVVGLAVSSWARIQTESLGLSRLASFLLFAALVSGCFALMLQAILWKVRRVPPPSGISVFALVVSVVPLLLAI